MSNEKVGKSLHIGDGVWYHKNPNLNDLSISLETKEAFVFDFDQLSRTSQDFIAKLSLLNKIVDTEGKDESEIDTMKKMDDYTSKAVQTFLDRPLEAIMLNYADDILLTRVVEGVARFYVGGKEVLIVEAKNLPENARDQLIQNPEGAEIHLNSDLWQELESKGLTQEVITIDHYTPFCLERITGLVVFKHMPDSKAKDLLELFKDTEKEAQILNRVNDGKRMPNETNELIMDCRIQNAIKEMVKWKRALRHEQNADLAQRAGRIFGKFYQKLKGDPLEHSKLTNVENRKVEFFKGIERTIKGEKVF